MRISEEKYVSFGHILAICLAGQGYSVVKLKHTNRGEGMRDETGNQDLHTVNDI